MTMFSLSGSMLVMMRDSIWALRMFMTEQVPTGR